MRLIAALGWAALAALTAYTPCAHAGIIAYGSASVAPDPTITIDDILFASIAVDSNNVVTFTVRFDPATFTAGTSFAEFSLDLDRNPATGNPGIDNAGTDAGQIGADVFLESNGFQSAAGNIYQYIGPFDANLIGSLSPTLLPTGDGYTSTTTLSALGATSPFMNAGLTSASWLDATGSTAVADRFPALITVSAVPEPSTVWLECVGVAFVLAGAARRNLKRP